MSASREKLIEDVASASRTDPLIIRKIICNYQDSVAMLPALFALLGDLRLFLEYPLERLRVPHSSYWAFSLSGTLSSFLM